MTGYLGNMLCVSGELEIAETYMMQTREDLDRWQAEVQRRLDQETGCSVGKHTHNGRGSFSSSNARSGYSSSSNQSDDDDKDR